MINLLRSILRKDVPRWIVLIIDIYITIQSYLFVILIQKDFKGITSGKLLLDQVSFMDVVTVGLAYSIGFLASGSYKGIIRRTGFKDMELVLKACLFGAFLLALYSFLMRKVFDVPYQYVFAYHMIFNHCFLTIILLSFCRVLYKTIYANYILPKNDGIKKKNILIYGAGDSGNITYKVLVNDEKLGSLKVFGFIDDKSSKIGKTLNGVKIYASKEIDYSFLQRNQIVEIIISIQKISRKRLMQIVDQFSDFPVVLKIIPGVDKWMDGNLQASQIKPIKIEDLLGRESIKLKNPELKNQMSGKTVLVTGAAGSIGSELCRQLMKVEVGNLVFVDQAESALYDIQQEFKNVLDKCHFFVADILDANRLNTIFQEFKPDIVFHAAAYKHVPLMEKNPYEAVNTNVRGTKIVADLSVTYYVEKFIMVSTDKAVNPTNVMGATKRIAEIYVNSLNKLNRTQFIITRFGNVLGSNGSVIPLFKKQIENGGPVTVTHPEVTRYFMTIPEACQLVLEAGTMGKGGEIFVFDMGESMKIIDLAKKMIKMSGYNYPEEMDIKIVGLREGEKIYEELLANNENTIPTHHKKIMIAKVDNNQTPFLEKRINELCSFIESITFDKNHNFAIVKLVKDLIPEYISNNSVYETIDKELK